LARDGEEAGEDKQKDGKCRCGCAHYGETLAAKK